MVGDHIWPILFAVSLLVNVLLLARKPLLRLLRREDEVSEDEIMAMVEEGEESGAIQSNEKELIENIFEFNNITAEDVMIHRTDMVTLALDEEEDVILDTIRQSGLSRFPVYQNDVDDIVGILSTREYLLNFHLPDPKPIRELLRTAYFVPESVPADVLFRDMQGKKTHMALVVDEYGGTEGIITLEDILEELVGEIWDEHDEVTEDFRKQSDGSWIVLGSAGVDDLYERLGLPEDEDIDSNTVNGLVQEKTCRLPKVGDRFTLGGYDGVVTRTAKRRVTEVRLTPAEKPDTKKDEEEKGHFGRMTSK